jgi:phosphonate transport system substrate-binding protein
VHRRLALTSLLLLGAAAIAASACRRRDLDSVGEPATPLVLLVSRAHGERLTPEQRETMRRFLAAESGLAVEVWVAPGDEEAIHAIAANRADAALLPLGEYLFLHREYGVRASLRVLRDGGADRYGGEILVRADGPIRSLADLAGRKVAFVGGWSTTGFVLPARLLRDAGARPEAVFTGSHAASLAALRGGEVDAAVTFAGAASADPGLRVLASTPTVPNEPVFYRRGVPEAKRLRLDRALLAFAASAEGRAVLERIAGAHGLTPTTDAAYAEGEEVLRMNGVRLEDLVADGWKIAGENQMPLSSYAP